MRYPSRLKGSKTRILIRTGLSSLKPDQGTKKTYHRVDVVPQDEYSQSTDKEVHIGSTDKLVERESYTIYSTEYKGKEEVFVGLQAVGNWQGEIREFNSAVFNLNCEDMFLEEVKNAVMSTFDENEFKVTATEKEGQKTGSETVWNISAFVAYHSQHEPRFHLADLEKPLGVILLLGWSWHVLF